MLEVVYSVVEGGGRRTCSGLSVTVEEPEKKKKKHSKSNGARRQRWLLYGC